MQKLEIVDIKVNEGVARSTGRPYKITEAQCILWPSREGDPKVVGRLSLPDQFLTAGNPAPGEYRAEFAMVADFEGRLVGRLSRLEPMNPAPKPQAKPGVTA